MMNLIFVNEMAQQWLIIYMNDMAIHTKPHPDKTPKWHLEWHWTYIKRVLSHLKEYNLYLKLEKWSFKQPNIKFLGVMLKQGTVQMDDKKIKKVKNWEPPKMIIEV